MVVAGEWTQSRRLQKNEEKEQARRTKQGAILVIDTQDISCRPCLVPSPSHTHRLIDLLRAICSGLLQ